MINRSQGFVSHYTGCVESIRVSSSALGRLFYRAICCEPNLLGGASLRLMRVVPLTEDSQIHSVSTTAREILLSGDFEEVKRFIEKSPDFLFQKSVEFQSQLEESQLVELIEIAIKKMDPEEIAIFLRNYFIHQSFRVQVAKLVATQSLRGISEFIQDYGIIDERARIEIAKLGVTKHARVVSECIQNYEIMDEKARAEIAKLAAVKNGVAVSVYLKNYKITDEKVRIEIGKLAAAKDARAVSNYIHMYEITDEKGRIQIAKAAAAKEARMFCECIQNYKITDEKARVEIAKIAVSQDAGAVCEYIQSYHIQDEKARIEIAKLAAFEDGEAISLHIRDYKIIDEKARIEIAEIVATEDVVAFSLYIENYEIFDEKARIKLAKFVAAEYGGGSVSRYIKNYRITDEKARIEIAIIAIKQSPLRVVLSHFLRADTLSTPSIYEDLSFMKLSYGIAKMQREALMEFEIEDGFAHVLSKGEFLLTQNVNAFDFFKWYIYRRLEKFPDFKKYVEVMCKYRNKQLLGQLLYAFITQMRSGDYRYIYSKLAKTVPAYLPSVMVSKWMKEDGVISSLSLTAFFSHFGKKLKDKACPLLSMYLQTAVALDELCDLPASKKLKLLVKICESKRKNKEEQLEDILSGLGLLYSFAKRREGALLSAIDTENIRDSLEVFFHEMLLQDPMMDVSGIDYLQKRYSESFEKTRVPLAMEIYKAKMSVLPDLAVKNTLNLFIRSVLLGTFKSERYRTDNNPHLRKIQEYGFQVFDRWRSLAVNPIRLANSSNKLVAYRDFFLVKLEEQHWKKDDFPKLSSFLFKGEWGNRSGDMQDLCIRLILDATLSEELQIDLLRKIEKSPKLQRVELLNDIRRRIKTLQEGVSLQEVAVLSTDWQDLFLSGTEVLGSCQKVDGNPMYSRCLLAYCLDGKNALIAVKDTKGKIVARSILRVLWDETNQKPVLFLEQVYPVHCSNERQGAILSIAKASAQMLGLELFTYWSCFSKSEDKRDLISFGSSCPYEYVDGTRGVEPEGKFTIRSSYKINLFVV